MPTGEFGCWSRAPHGARGLKPLVVATLYYIISRAPHGARGLKPQRRGFLQGQGGRAPHGARGLKRINAYANEMDEEVAPRTGRVN